MLAKVVSKKLRAEIDRETETETVVLEKLQQQQLLTRQQQLEQQRVLSNMNTFTRPFTVAVNTSESATAGPGGSGVFVWVV